MPSASDSLFTLEAAIGDLIRSIGLVIDGFGVAIIVVGILWSTWAFVLRRMQECDYEAYRIRIGRSLLLGLEVLVAADIVKTIALEATFSSLGVLCGLVFVRTFLGWTLVLEIEGRWPWQRAMHPVAGQSRATSGTAALPSE